MSEPERRPNRPDQVAMSGGCHVTAEMTYLCVELQERVGSGYHLVLDGIDKTTDASVITNDVYDCYVIWLSGDG